LKHKVITKIAPAPQVREKLQCVQNSVSLCLLFIPPFTNENSLCRLAQVRVLTIKKRLGNDPKS